MSDLIKRLRRWNMAESGGDPTQSVMRDLNDAADRIEELEAEVESVAKIRLLNKELEAEKDDE
jgi:hypothetical protein